MKLVAFLTLWALASSVPLRESISQLPLNWWRLQVHGQDVNQPWQQGTRVVPQQLGPQNFASQLTQQIAEQLQQNQIQNAVLQQQGVSPLGQGAQKVLAQQVAQRIAQQVENTKQVLIQGVIQQLQQQLQQRLNVIGQQSVKQLQQNEIVDAIQQLQKIQQRSSVAAQVSQSQLVQTLESVLEAQLVSSNVENQLVVRSGQIFQKRAQNSERFEAQVQQLIRQSIIKDIQLEIARQERRIQQLQQQQQFVSQQKQQIQVEQTIAQQSQPQQLVQQLQLAQQILQQQEQQLLQQQLARQLVNEQLERIILGQQNLLQQDILNEQALEQISQSSWITAGSSQSGNSWTQVPSSRSRIINFLNQDDQQWNQVGNQPGSLWEQRNIV